MTPFAKLAICDPKRDSEAQTGRASWYPYYAGFSQAFAERLIASAGMEQESLVSDPWNGSGTTTAAAARLGHDAYGYDLNPVMVLAARARMLSKREKNSLIAIGTAVIKAAKPTDVIESEPLMTWFARNSACWLRGLERSIQEILISPQNTPMPTRIERIQQMSDLAAFFYVALFRTTRGLLDRFGASNPTWIKKPKSLRERLRPAPDHVKDTFLKQVGLMTNAIDEDPATKDSEVKIAVGSSNRIPLSDNCVDLVLSSPPYCTRIDYAVATYPELAVLGYRIESEVDNLRRQLIGTATVPRVAPQQEESWGKCCNQFLIGIRTHHSKASATYYLKNHLQYFASMYGSIGEIARTLKRGGACVLVVQDSYYKNLHNDLPRVIVEMSDNQSMTLRRQVSFRHARTMANVNPRVRQYRGQMCATESVLCFSRN